MKGNDLLLLLKGMSNVDAEVIIDTGDKFMEVTGCRLQLTYTLDGNIPYIAIRTYREGEDGKSNSNI